MNLLAIDPGNLDSGYCLMDTETLRPIEFGKISNHELENLLANMHIGQIVIEKIVSYGMAVGKEVFDTCVEIGRLSMIAEILRIPCGFVYRRDEKLTICGSPRANDSNIRKALIDRFATHDFKNGKGTKADPDWFYGFKADVWAAYAVGVTWRELNGYQG